jgi:hypothetical protein
MAFAQGSRSGLAYVVESSFGVIPPIPSMTDLPFKSHSLDLTKEPLESMTIRSDRNRENFRHGNQQVGGDITLEMRATDYDDLLESAFFSTFDSLNVLKNGVTQRSFTIEDRAEDISQYRVFTGCVVNKMAMKIKPNAIVESVFSLVGSGMEPISTSPLDANITPAGTNDPFDSFSGQLKEAGVLIATITSMEFSITNGVNPTFVVGSDKTPQLESGRCVVEGTLQAYYEDATLMNKFINETESSIELNLDDAVSGNVYQFYFPRVKYNGASAPVDKEGSRIISIPFVALYSSAEGATVKLSKV